MKEKNNLLGTNLKNAKLRIIDKESAELEMVNRKSVKLEGTKLKMLKAKILSALIILAILLNFSPAFLYADDEYINGEWSNLSVRIVLNNGSDALSGHKSTVYSVSGATPVVTNATEPLTITADGTTTIGISTADNAGNTATRSYSIRLDKTAPTVGVLTMKLDNSSGSNYTSDTWTNHSVYISLANGTDTGSGHKSTVYTLTGATTASNQTGSTTITAEGITNVLVATEDNAGNSTTKSYLIKIDKTNPVVGTLTMTKGAISDGSWNTSKNVNSPKIAGTGLIPVTLAADGTPTEVTDVTTDWYDYNTTTNSSRWANAVTKDSSGNITGYFVWIPRYAYKITSGCYTSTAGTIEIKFLKGTTDLDSTGATISESYPTVSSGEMTNFVVHPAFTTNIANGGWDSNISGFWVAKYPAGYQASTINASGTLQNASDTVVRSNLNYSGTDNYTVNAVDSTLSTSTKISYPVFKPLTYAYNCIRIGDMYSLSGDIQNATGFYGLNNVDSHLEKNSEWGAVAYLTQSNYGRNGTEININNYSRNNSSKNIYSVTGLCAAGTTNNYTTSISSVNAYNTTTGFLGSSTGNITGVYDLNGCIFEEEAGYITNGNSNLVNYSNSFANTTADATPQTNGRSTKWVTAYPYDSSSDSYSNNETKYNSFKSSTYGFGDAILETKSWNGDDCGFPCTATPFFRRGGFYVNSSRAGVFCYDSTVVGSCHFTDGFRVVLIS